MTQKSNKATSYHLRCDIQGLLQNYKNQKITFLQNSKGGFYSDKEARAQLAELLALGWKYIRVGNCPNFDPFEKGCPGHPVEE